MNNCNSKRRISNIDEIADLSTLIIDSNKGAANELAAILGKGGITSIQKVYSLNKLEELIVSFDPQLIFIDPEGFSAKQANLFEELRSLSPKNRLYITSSKKYLEQLTTVFGSIILLEKPVQFAKLDEIITNFLHMRKIDRLEQKLDRLYNNICPEKLKFSTRKGHVFVDPGEIVYFKADSNYTHIYLKNNKQITVAKSLRHFDEGLKSSNFMRISRSVIINTTFLTALDRNDKSCLLKYSGDEISIPITKNHLAPLLQSFMLC